MDTVHKGDNDDDYDNNNNNNNNPFYGQNNFPGYKLSVNLLICVRYENRCQFLALDTPVCLSG